MTSKARVLGGVIGLSLAAAIYAADAAATAAAPAAPAAAAAPAAPADKYPDLNKTFVREWTVEELYRGGNLALNAAGRSYERGEAIWQASACKTCHRFNGGFGGIGPDLTGAGAKFDVKALLTEIIDPSENISDLYGTKTVYLDDGKKYIGRPMGQTADAYVIVQTWGIDNTTGSSAWNGPPLEIPDAKIVDIEDSGISPMPPGQLNNLQQEEIYDFLAYLISDGDPSNRMFKVKAAATAPKAP